MRHVFFVYFLESHYDDFVNSIFIVINCRFRAGTFWWCVPRRFPFLCVCFFVTVFRSWCCDKRIAYHCLCYCATLRRAFKFRAFSLTLVFLQCENCRASDASKFNLFLYAIMIFLHCVFVVRVISVSCSLSNILIIVFICSSLLISSKITLLWNCTERSAKSALQFCRWWRWKVFLQLVFRRNMWLL